MNLTLETSIPSAQQYWYLFQTTGWNSEYQLTPEQLLETLRASWFVLAAYDDGKLIGCGRIVSDRVMHAMIYDLIVLPEYQGTGVGSQILKKLLAHCEQAGVHDVQLFSAQGKRGFYEKHGFIARPDDGPGMQYLVAARKDKNFAAQDSTGDTCSTS